MFLSHEPYPFHLRSRLRRRALRVVAAAATAVRASVTAATTATASLQGTGGALGCGPTAAAATAAAAASNVGAALDRNVWPALAALLEADFPARGGGGSGSNGGGNSDNVTLPLDGGYHVSTSQPIGGSGPFAPAGSGCTRYAIEAAARTIAALLKCGAWGWGRAEREVPLNPEH